MSIIGISGRIGSGKDTVGEIIKKLCLTNKGPEFEIKKFAGKLKTIASLLTGISIEKWEDQEFKNLEMPEGWNMTYRTFLQKLGTEGMRIGVHTNVWVNSLFADYKPQDAPYKNLGDLLEDKHNGLLNNPNWIITDMRFPNELEAIKSRGGITIRVNRPMGGSKFEGTQEKWDKLVERNKQSTHASETALDNTEFDYVIDNTGSIKDLIEKVREILVKEKII